MHIQTDSYLYQKKQQYHINLQTKTYKTAKIDKEKGLFCSKLKKINNIIKKLQRK